MYARRSLAQAIWFLLLCLWSLGQASTSDGGASLSTRAAASTRSDSSSHEVSNSCTVGTEEDERIPLEGRPDTLLERSFIAVKPDGVQRGLVGEVVTRFERKGWKLVGIKMMIPSRDLVKLHYEEHQDKAFFDALVEYFTSGPLVAMVWEGHDVIASARKMLGTTNPSHAEIGTIRGDLCTSSGRNLVHASDSVQSAAREIRLWFQPEEALAWSRAADPWINVNM